jgi:hypothetical protein
VRTALHFFTKFVIPDNALGALIQNLVGLKKIPGSPRRGAPE